MFMDDYIKLDACGLSQAIRQGAVVPEKVLEFAYGRIAEKNPALNAITHLCEERARRTLQTMRGDEPFYGVPFLIKELGLTLKGEPSRDGAMLTKEVRASHSFGLWDNLITLGFVPVGFTASPEFGLSYTTEPKLFGPCRNPWDTGYTPGGSSGGAAAAVASGMTPFASASDGVGSIRVPAACCGLVGFKPSSQVLPSEPLSYLPWFGLAVSFGLSRSLRDVKTVFDGLLQQHAGPRLSAKRTRPPKFLIAEKLLAAEQIQGRWSEGLQQFCTQLDAEGYTVESWEETLNMAEISACALNVIAASCAAGLTFLESQRQRPIAPQEVENVSWELFQKGKQLPASTLLQSRDRLFQALAPLRQCLADGDVLLTPTLAKDPLPIGAVSMGLPFAEFMEKERRFSPFTSLANLAGIPAISLPIATNDRFPRAVQLIMGEWRDRELLSLCETLLAQQIWRESPVAL